MCHKNYSPATNTLSISYVADPDEDDIYLNPIYTLSPIYEFKSTLPESVQDDQLLSSVSRMTDNSVQFPSDEGSPPE